MSQEKNAPKVVAPRNDPPEAVLTARDSSPLDSEGRDPNFEYCYMSTNPRHPNFAGKFLRRQKIHDVDNKVAIMEPWETVTDDTDPALELGRPRQDQGAALDSLKRVGTMILMRTPKANARIKEDAEQRIRNRMDKTLHSKQRESSGNSTVTYGVSRDENADVNRVAFGG